MTNLEWLHSLEPKELGEWFAAEHMDTRAERMCKIIDRGSFMPKHDFYRSECSACGAMFWQTKGHLPHANYCPTCGAKVVE